MLHSTTLYYIILTFDSSGVRRGAEDHAQPLIASEEAIHYFYYYYYFYY